MHRRGKMDYERYGIWNIRNMKYERYRWEGMKIPDRERADCVLDQGTREGTKLQRVRRAKFHPEVENEKRSGEVKVSKKERHLLRARSPSVLFGHPPHSQSRRADCGCHCKSPSCPCPRWPASRGRESRRRRRVTRRRSRG
jgi:hypothetical protein